MSGRGLLNCDGKSCSRWTDWVVVGRGRAASEFEVLRFKFEAAAGLETWDSHPAREDTRPTDEGQIRLDGVSTHRLRAVRSPASLTGWGWVPYNPLSPSNSNV